MLQLRCEANYRPHFRWKVGWANVVPTTFPVEDWLGRNCVDHFPVESGWAELVSTTFRWKAGWAEMVSTTFRWKVGWATIASTTFPLEGWLAIPTLGLLCSVCFVMAWLPYSINMSYALVGGNGYQR